MIQTPLPQKSATPSPSPSWLRANAWPLALLAVGAGLRLEQYLRNPSLRLDEALLSLNLVNRSFAGLWRPLDYGQAAPPLFLMVERVALLLGGRSEYALRALPLLASLAALPLLWLLARRWIGRRGALVALALFAVSYEPLRFAREVKQYSVEILVALLLYLGLGAALARPLRWTQVALWSVLGVLAIFASNSAMFVLGGMALVQLLPALRARDARRALPLVVLGAVWAAGCGAFYWLLGRHLHAETGLAEYWGNGYLPLPPRSAADVRWFLDTFFGFFENPGGFQYSAVAALPCLAGAVYLRRRDDQRFWYLLAPVLLALVASALHLYPFTDRLVLFLLPAALLLNGAGVEYFAGHLGPRAPVTIFLIALLLVPLYMRVPGLITEPELVRDTRPLLQYFAAHRQPGDVLYVYRYAWAATTFYLPRFGLDPKDIVWGQESSYTDEFARLQELKKIAGRGRVWLLFAEEVPNWQGINDEKYLTHYLDAHATKLDTQKRLNAGLYLYDVTNTPAPPGP
jgi:hypothetical protein